MKRLLMTAAAGLLMTTAAHAENNRVPANSNRSKQKAVRKQAAG